MAILSNGKFYGFLCSAKETGRKLTNGVKEYVEDFVTGFTGHGWKIWEYVKGKWMLEIDSIRVRGQFTVFELLVSKIRAIIGAQTITQGCGKIKTVEISDDGTAYLITLEDEDMSFVEHDFIRCEEFAGEKRNYHVEIESVVGGVIRIPISEFEIDEGGFVQNTPKPGDDIVQFGNSSHDEKYIGRHSAIYMHADESAQPAIDVLDGIYSKDWSDCLKVRMGGDIPGSDGLKGLYCVNGMIKGTDKAGTVLYQFNPDGSGFIGKGSIKWDKNGFRFGTDVKLAWDNLDSDAQENLKGEAGKDANLLPWVEEWNNNKTLIGDEYVVSVKTFSGTNTGTLENPTLTGVAMGKEVIKIGDKKKTGLFGIKDNQITFSLDSETGDLYMSNEMFAKLVKTNGIIISNEKDEKNIFSLNFTEKDDGSIEPMLVIKTTKYGEYFPSITIEGSEIYGVGEVGDLGGRTYDLEWKISKDGFDFRKDYWGFKLGVDSEKTTYNVSTPFSRYAVNISRIRFGYLPDYQRANGGDLYVEQDGTLKIKDYKPDF